MTKNAPPITTVEARILELETVVHACSVEVERLTERFQKVSLVRHPSGHEEVARKAEADEVKRDVNRAQMARCDAQIALAEARRDVLVDDVDSSEVEAAKCALDEAQQVYTELVNRRKRAADESRGIESAIKSYRVTRADREEDVAIISRRIAARIADGEHRRLLAGIVTEGPGFSQPDRS